MNYKMLALASLSFACGMAFTVACNAGGSAPLVGTAHAAGSDVARCAAWEFTVWSGPRGTMRPAARPRSMTPKGRRAPSQTAGSRSPQAAPTAS